MMGALMSRGAARGIGFSHLVGTGNEADLSAAEIAGLLVDDPQVDAILLFLEAIRRPEHFADLARRAHAAGKPVVAYKLGRSPYGAELAASHTGALAGTDAAADAFFRAHRHRARHDPRRRCSSCRRCSPAAGPCPARIARSAS